MKKLFIALALAFCAFAPAFAFAGETRVPGFASKDLFDALQEAYPSSVEGFNHTQELYLSSVSCQSNEDEFRCNGINGNGEAVTVDIDNGVEEGRKLDNLWSTMKYARLPVKHLRLSSYLELKYIACTHTMPSQGLDSYECSYRE